MRGASAVSCNLHLIRCPPQDSFHFWGDGVLHISHKAEHPCAQAHFFRAVLAPR